MKGHRIYIILTGIIVFAAIGLAGVKSANAKFSGNTAFFLNPPDSTYSPDSTLVYPFGDEWGYPTMPANESGLYFNNPPNITSEVEYDPETNEYILKRKVGSLDYRSPVKMDFDEYLKYNEEQSVNKYWRERSAQSGQDMRNGLIPEFRIGGETFDRIFGSNTIEVRPQGAAELIFGVISNHREDPALDVRQQRTTNFDFQMKIQMSVMAKIGDKIEFNTNYNTEATFDFENKLKLAYEGKEDEIIQLIEAGNVTLPLNSTLITGSQSLFGIKTQLRFGKATVTAVFSEQKSETQNISVQGGAQTTEYSLKADDYEDNKHFFLGQYFRDNYEKALSTLPIVTSNINITKIEVWVTNIGSAVTENRNIIAFSDIGEYTPYNPNIYSNGNNRFPDNESNSMLYDLDTNQIRNINTAYNYLLNNPLDLTQGIDFEKVESARKLASSEYSYNSKLGFISLNTALNSDQVLAVAYQYTVNEAVYQVGEFSDQGISSPNTLMVKLLRSTSINTKIPMWNLMMKNVYSIGAYQINREDFLLNILYAGNNNGVPTGYLTEGPEDIQGVPLIRVLNLDNLDPQLNPPHDGTFDFIDNAATQGGTVNSSNGRIFFTVLEPFGSYLRSKLPENLANKYCYDSLYSLTKTGARQYPDKNKFYIEGMYKSSSGSEIDLNAFNIPQGSVQVTAGGTQLREDQDYTVDYTLGRVTIINEGILNSGTPINISLENNSMFALKSQTLSGFHVDYNLSDNINLGATLLNLNERPLTVKTNYGDEPISNTIWGMDFQYQKESPFITTLVDKLPFYSTKVPSMVSIDGEFAHFIPGHSKAIGDAGTSYIDDFEGSKSTIDLKNIGLWFLSSTPANRPEYSSGTLEYGFNRAKLAWYIIDPLFYQKSGNLKPDNIDSEELSNHFVRMVREQEVFPNAETANGQPVNLAVFNLAYYPKERGPYNFNVNGLDVDGFLSNPGNNWGGVMRKIETTDFEAMNVEYVEFWLMDPFADPDGDGPLEPINSTGGKLLINLGDISEDILRDSRKSFENGLPLNAEDITNVDTTLWGRVPTLQNLVPSFDPDSRPFQDVGYDGLRNEDELTFFEEPYLNKLIERFGTVGAPAVQAAYEDPAGDDYHYFRGYDYDADDKYSSILERYKEYNGTEGNSQTPESMEEVYPTQATGIPNVEDINGDNTLSESNNYYEYEINLRPDHMEIGENYIADIYEANGIALDNGTRGSVKWYQFKVPVTNPTRVIGSIQDYTSIRFIRMYMTDFSETAVLRFGTLELVRGEWRRYNYDLLSPGEYIPNDITNDTRLDVSTVSIEENGGATDRVPYALPPGIEREKNVNTTNLQQENEQSMSMTINNLIDGDARAAYKNTDFDFRQFNTLKMFIHAEALSQEDDSRYAGKTGPLTVFLRLGADFTENYYEYEVPIEFTPWGTSSINEEIIWPEGNEMIIDLETLVNVKQNRNALISDPESNVTYSTPYWENDGKNKITVVGTPSLSDVRVLMVGVRNPKKQLLSDDDDGLPMSAEIWINELRMTDFDEKGGWAATARMNANLADLGNVSLSGLYSTPGFGSIEKSVNERAQETTSSWDFATNVELGKFFNEESGIKIPMHFDISESRLIPEYNPLDPDIYLKDDLAMLDAAGRDSLKEMTQDYTMRKNINFVNVRKDRGGSLKKDGTPRAPMPWNISNFDVSYSYSEIYHRNIDIEYDTRKQYRGGLGYNFSTQPKQIKPFGKVKFLNKKAFALIRDFNFYLLPKMMSFRTDLDRQYTEKKLRNKSRGDIIIEPTYMKEFDWSRLYNLKYDLAQSLKLDFSASALSYIDEPAGKPVRDSIYDQMRNLGTMNSYNQNFKVNWNLPINKIPLMNWLGATVRYDATYRWQASPQSVQSVLGNTVENSRNATANANVRLSSLYKNIPYVKNLDRKKTSNNNRKSSRTRQTMQNEQGAEQDTAQNKKPRINFVKEGFDGILRIIFGVKDASLAYTRNSGNLMPGFMPEPTILGNRTTDWAPGLDYVFGFNQDIRARAVANNWLTTDTLNNSQFINNFSETINYRINYEPFKNFRFEITGNRRTSENYSEIFKADAFGQFQSYAAARTGSYSISLITWNTAFGNDELDENKSANFEQLKTNRRDIAFRMAESNPNWVAAGRPMQTDTITGQEYPVGYGPTQQDILIPAFIAAYTGTDASNIDLTSFPVIPLPNWRLTWNGLTQIPWIKQYFRNINISHSYKSAFNIGSYQTNLLYEELFGYPNAFDDAGNYVSQNLMNVVTITEQFSPLINIDMTMVNSLLARFEIKKSRNLTMSFVNNQLTEVKSNELIVGLGYRFQDVQFTIRTVGGSGKKSRVKSDLNVKIDFSMRDNKTVLRRLDEEINQASAGQRIFSINTSADYQMNRNLTLRLFYDQTLTRPHIASQYNNSTINSGISVRFTLAQ